jgi:XRE family transcriptional regulator, aerobic/anaerobic benzoate catabolism transcriptional regulator
MSIEAHTHTNLAASTVVADDAGPFLLWLGKRVREARARRGMTRKQMAQDADVSERHLAQLESGEGNISVVLLRRIAAALDVPLAELFAAERAEPAAKQTIRRVLEGLPANHLDEVSARLLREFGADQAKRNARIALIGLRGAGKSTLGKLLARELEAPFIELDREIEKDAAMALDEIFSLYGQTGYRRIEKRTLARVLDERDRGVISVGGGVVSEKETYAQLLANCLTIWIKAQPEEHMSRVIAQGDFRAMAENDEAMDDLRRILLAREPDYQKADMCLDTSGESVEQSFVKLKQSLQSNGSSISLK